jgi:hypothetical protein
MANEIRSRTNLVNGTLSVALASGDTTMSSAGLANLAAITSANHAVIVIENEIIWVTAHTASATTATILRAQEGTAAAAHAQNVAWLHAPVVSDFDSVLGYVQIVANTSPAVPGPTDIAGLTTTVTVPYAQHRVKISAHTLVQSTVADDNFQLLVMEGATQLAAGNSTLRPANQNVSLDAYAIIVPSAASHTYKLQLTRVAGTGTVTVVAGSTAPSWLLVEDLGPAL